MRAAVLVGPRRLEVRELPVPNPAPGAVVVAIDRCGIGGSDVEAWLRGTVPAPAWFGHEWVGRIVAVGSDVDGRFEGERVVGATSPPCGSCAACVTGLGANCSRSLALILGADSMASPHGAFADHIHADARRLHRAPEGVDDDEAALAEPAAVAAHAVVRANQPLGAAVAVVGAGTIGILVAQMARVAGASRVLVIDPVDGRRELACSLGADAAVGPGAGLGSRLAEIGHGPGVDVAYECAGRPQALDSAVAAARAGGTVVIVGASEVAGTVSPAQLVIKELTVHASRGYDVGDVRRALALMAEERVRTAALCGGRVGFDGLADALDRLSSDPQARRKMLFDPRL